MACGILAPGNLRVNASRHFPDTAITLRDWHALSYNPMLDLQAPLAIIRSANSDRWNCFESSSHSISAPHAQAPLEAPEAS
jgi:hypothetical protein